MRSLGKRQTGGRVAAPIWTGFMKTALADEPVESFSVPPDIEFVEVESSSGLLAPPGSVNKLTQPFQAGTAPTKYHDPDEDERMAEDIMHIFPTDLPL
jgi:penicillin-binding protein 1A